MKTSILVDTNILIDVFDDTQEWHGWSRDRFREALLEGPAVINPVIYAELSTRYATKDALDAQFPSAFYRREDLPWEAAFLAGKAFAAYRRSGGTRCSPLPDFYIGAHAEVRGYLLLTRDRARYATYFPTVSLIAPDTHP